jgi:hypothetical protein
LATYQEKADAESKEAQHLFDLAAKDLGVPLPKYMKKV